MILQKQATEHVFTITNVLTPSSKVAAGTVTITTQDSSSRNIDTAATMTTDLIDPGALTAKTPAAFETATDTPGFYSVATVTFTTAGRVEIGGKVELVLPDKATGGDAQQSTWEVTDGTGVATTGTNAADTANAPAIAFTSPTTNAGASVTYVANDRKLTFTVQTAKLKQEEEVSFTITNVRTPSSLTASQNVKGRTLDDKDKDIDGDTAGSNLATEAITVGALEAGAATLSFDTATDTPGFESVATVKFKTAGRVEANGLVKIVMPDLGTNVQAGWRFTDAANAGKDGAISAGTANVPAIAFTTPNTGGPVPGTITYTTADRELKFTCGTNGMAQATEHVFTITNVLTPSSKVAAGTVTMTTQDSQSRNIDTTATMATDKIDPGALTAQAPAAFETATDTPGFYSVATVTFTTAGRVEIGGKVELVLPDKAAGGDAQQSTWEVTDGTGVATTGTNAADTANAPAIAFTSPTTNAGASVTYVANDRKLTFTVQTAKMKQEEEVVFTITNVRTPSSLTASQNVKGRTLDDKDKDIDGNTAGSDLATEAIVKGAIVAGTGGLKFETNTDTPGFADVATVSFKTAGRVPTGGKVKITMPDLGTNVQSGWRFTDAAKARDWHNDPPHHCFHHASHGCWFNGRRLHRPGLNIHHNYGSHGPRVDIHFYHHKRALTVFSAGRREHWHGDTR